MAENPELANISPSYPFDVEPQDTGQDAGQEAGQDADQSVVDQDTSQDVDQDAGGETKKGDPTEAIVALRKENQALKAQIQQVAAYLQQQQQARPQQQKQEPPDPLGKLDDDDVITVADMKRVLQFYAQQQAAAAPQQPQVDPRELQIRAQYDDYDESIKQIPALIQEHPHLRSAILGSENPYATAYSLVQLYKGKAERGDKTAKKLMDNLSKPRSSGKVASGGGASKANYYATLDDKGLEAMIAKVKRGA